MDDRQQLIDKLIASGGFWSYSEESVRKSVSDDQLIEATLEKLDIDDIDKLFDLYSFKRIKRVWLKTMVIQGDYFYDLNRFFAWYYFDIHYPDRYLKSMMTRHIHSFS